MPVPLVACIHPVILHDENGNPINGGNPLPVTGGGGGGGTNQPTFAVNQATVTVPGTAVQLQNQAVPNGFTIFLRAKKTNSGNIYVGPDAVTAENHAKAVILEPGAFLTYALTNVDAIFIDADDANDGVMWTVEIP